MSTLQDRLVALAGAVRDKINLVVPRLQPQGGIQYQVLAKNTANDYDSSWLTLATIARSGSAGDLTGTVAAARLPAMTGGDVTSTAGSAALTIGAGTVTLAKMANLGANTILGNNTGVSATPIALTAAQVKTMLGLGTGGSSYAIKGSDTNRASTTTTTADTDLQIALAVGTWRVRVVAFFDVGSSTPGIKYDMSFTGTGSWGARVFRSVNPGTSAGTGAESQGAALGMATVSISPSSASGDGYLSVEAVLTVTVAGTVQFRWAQASSSTITTTLKGGAYMECTQMA